MGSGITSCGSGSVGRLSKGGSEGSFGNDGSAGSEGTGRGIVSASVGRLGRLGKGGNEGSLGSDGSAGSEGMGSGITSCGIGSVGSSHLQTMARLHLRVTDFDIAGFIGDDKGMGTGSGGPLGPIAVGWVWASKRAAKARPKIAGSIAPSPS